MILPEKTYNALPYIWAGCSMFSAVFGLPAIVSSVLFLCTSILVFIMRNQQKMALVTFLTYVSFIILVGFK